MKRVLVLNCEFPPVGGGASPVSSTIATFLSETGEYDIDVVTMGYRGLSRCKEINKRLRVHRLWSGRLRKDRSYPWQHIIFIIRGFLYSRMLIKQNKYDICHCHFIVPTGVIAYALNKIYKLPYVIHAHGSDVLYYNPRFLYLYRCISPIWKSIIFSAEYIIVPSIYLKERIVSIVPHISKEHIKVIPNPISINQDVKAVSDVYSRKNIVLVMSRLIKDKGVQDVIEAMKMINNPAWSLVIVGDGPYRKELESMGGGEFIGWIDRQDIRMRKYLAEARIFVSASRQESFGMSLLEAISCGCIPLVSNIPAHVEIVGSEFIFTLGDINDLRNKLEYFMNTSNITIPDVSNYSIEKVGAMYPALF